METLNNNDTMGVQRGKINDNDSELSEKNGVFASLSASANTTVTTAGTYYPIAGTFTNYPIENFAEGTVVTPSIKYTGTHTKDFEIDWHASVKGDAVGITVHIGVKKGTTLVASSVMGTYLKAVGEVQALSGTCSVELSTDDEIQLVLTSDSDGDVISVDHYTTTIKPFFY